MAGVEIATNEGGTVTPPDISSQITNMSDYLREVLTPGANRETLGEEAWKKFTQAVENTRGKETTGPFEYYRKSQAVYEQLASYAEEWEVATSGEGHSGPEQKAIARGVRKVGKELKDLFATGLAEDAFMLEAEGEGEEASYHIVPIDLWEEAIMEAWKKFLSSTFPRGRAKPKKE